MFAGIPIHLLMLTTMCPDIIFSRLTVIWTFGVVTTLLGFILIKIKRHGYPFFLGSHAKKGIGYPIRVLSSIAPPYTTRASAVEQSTRLSLARRSRRPAQPVMTKPNRLDI